MSSRSRTVNEILFEKPWVGHKNHGFFIKTMGFHKNHGIFQSV